jgi:hypothetical protein
MNSYQLQHIILLPVRAMPLFGQAMPLLEVGSPPYVALGAPFDHTEVKLI